MPSLISDRAMRCAAIEPRSSRPVSASRMERGKSRWTCAAPDHRAGEALAREGGADRRQPQLGVLGGHADEGDRTGGAGHGEGLDHELGPAHHLEAEVGAPATGERPDLVDDVPVGGVDGIRGTDGQTRTSRAPTAGGSRSSSTSGAALS